MERLLPNTKPPEIQITSIKRMDDQTVVRKREKATNYTFSFDTYSLLSFVLCLERYMYVVLQIAFKNNSVPIIRGTHVTNCLLTLKTTMADRISVFSSCL